MLREEDTLSQSLRGSALRVVCLGIRLGARRGSTLRSFAFHAPSHKAAIAPRFNGEQRYEKLHLSYQLDPAGIQMIQPADDANFLLVVIVIQNRCFIPQIFNSHDDVLLGHID